MSTSDSNSYVFEPADAGADVSQQIRDISEVPAIEVITGVLDGLASGPTCAFALARNANRTQL